MGITRIDHIYAETNHWESSVTFWEGLGFVFAQQWGSEGHRAGRLECGQAAVVLAEVDGEPAFNVFFDVADGESFTPASAVEVVTERSETHWGTTWTRVRDPEGRIHSLEEASA